VTEISATNAARNFAELLDAVEHNGERITIIRRGRPVAHIEPVPNGLGSDVKTLLKNHRADAKWKADLERTRNLVVVEERF
jgi:prevent-host-death family protein